MDPKVVETLAIAEQFMHNARFAGAPRQAIADGFSSIDALFSAVLLEAGIEPPRNHKKKLDAVRVHAPSIFETRSEQVRSGWSYMGGIEWAKHPDCKRIFVFVYDPTKNIANPRGVEADLSVPRPPIGEVVTFIQQG